MLVAFILASASFTSATSKTQGLSEDRLEEFAQNNILFYDPSTSNCVSGARFSSICGSTPKEKYWSALRQELDEIHAAAIFGNIDAEGVFGPTRWEIGMNVTGDGGTFIIPWDELYNNCYGGCWGVGSFGLTMRLTPYLQYVYKENPDLLKYFQDPTNYSWAGDIALEKIGEADYDRIVEQEVRYVLTEAVKDAIGGGGIEEFKATATLDEATDWWTKNFENCRDCHLIGELNRRRGFAQKEYDEMKDFTCTASSSPKSGSSSVSTNTVSGNDITWIGDSYSVQADNKGLLSGKFPGVDIGPGSNDTSLSYIQGSKFVSSGSSSNPSCLTILQNIIDANKLRPYLVFACGTNGGWSDGDTAKFTEMLKDKDTKAIVVTSKIPGDDYADSNNRLRAMVEANDNIYLADWTSVYNADYFAGDPEKIHPVTDPGYEKWIGIISDTLSISSGSGCSTGEFVYYPQFLEPWSSVVYTADGVSSTIGEDGCGPTAFAMLANMLLPQEITPADTIKVAADTHSIVAGLGSIGSVLTKNLAEYYGLEWEKLDNSSTEASMNDITRHLKEGWMIMTAGAGSVPYTGGSGHYVGIRGITDDGKWLLADSGHYEEVSQQPWNPEDVMAAGMNPDNVYAIRATSSTMCDNVCSDKGIGTADGFLSVAEAERVLISAYNTADLSSYGLLLASTEGGYHDNCVAFSTWFINHYTEISYSDPPNGNKLVRDFYSRNVSKYPKLKITDTPTVYSVASWSDPTLSIGSDNHTGIVVGIDEANDKILIAEAAWENHSFTGVHEYSYSEAKGHGKYINLNDYLKPNTGLK